MSQQKARGFTLIELLIVIALIAVLAGAVIIALNPARQFQQARDSERWSHVSAIAGAIQQNISENHGTWSCAAGALPTSSTVMAATSTDAGAYNICGCLVPNQAASMPFDPANGFFYNSCNDYNTGYFIAKNATTSRITVTAVPEITSAISVTQ